MSFHNYAKAGSTKAEKVDTGAWVLTTELAGGDRCGWVKSSISLDRYIFEDHGKVKWHDNYSKEAGNFSFYANRVEILPDGHTLRAEIHGHISELDLGERISNRFGTLNFNK